MEPNVNPPVAPVAPVPAIELFMKGFKAETPGDCDFAIEGVGLEFNEGIPTTEVGPEMEGELDLLNENPLIGKVFA